MPEQTNPIYSGKQEDFHWAGFGSGSGTNLRECAKVIKPALIFSDRPTAKLLTLEELAAPKIVINGYEACGSWKKAQGNQTEEAEYRKRSVEYNKQIVDSLKRFEDEDGYSIDLIVLGGYMRLVEEPLLLAYPDKIINVHPANLGIPNEKRKRKFVGEDAVYDAIKARETETRSSVIMVDDGIDHGEILVQGPKIKVWEEYINGTNPEQEECLRKYADAHQAMQKVRSDWPALTFALKMISKGRIALGTTKELNNEWRAVYLNGKKLPYDGYKIE